MNNTSLKQFFFLTQVDFLFKIAFAFYLEYHCLAVKLTGYI